MNGTSQKGLCNKALPKLRNARYSKSYMKANSELHYTYIWTTSNLTLRIFRPNMVQIPVWDNPYDSIHCKCDVLLCIMIRYAKRILQYFENLLSLHVLQYIFTLSINTCVSTTTSFGKQERCKISLSGKRRLYLRSTWVNVNTYHWVNVILLI